MKEDGCMTDLVHSVAVPVPAGREAYLLEIDRISKEIKDAPMVLSIEIIRVSRLQSVPVSGSLPR